jgi:hypothetical protein
MVGRAIVVAALFAVVFEVTCRIEDLIRYGTPILSPYTSQTDLVLRDEFGARGRPNARFQKWVLNGIGTRGPEVSASKPPTTLRVVTAGASETFGLYESPGREYPRQLEDSITESLSVLRCPDGRRFEHVEVVNAALPGMSLPTVALDVKHRIAGLAPDVIVYYPTPSQYLDELPPGSVPPRGRDADPRTDPTRALYPRAIARLRSQAKTILPGFVQTWLRQRETRRVLSARPEGWRFTRGVPQDRIEQFERDLRGMVGTMRATGATPILATNSNAFVGRERASNDVLIAWERFTPRATGDVILAFDSTAREVVRRVARDSAVAVADVEHAVHTPDAFADFLHFTDAGAAGVAGTMARTIVGEIGKSACGARPDTGSAPSSLGATDSPSCRRADAASCTRGTGTRANTAG